MCSTFKGRGFEPFKSTYMRDTELFNLIQRETERQTIGLELIASENYVSDEVLQAMGSILTNKYAEGYPGKRYYGGCEVVDEVENLARARAAELFGVEYVNVQPHSGSQANAAVYLACLNPGDRILGFDLSHGGHLTHGSPVNFSGKLYEAHFYGVEKETGLINWDSVEQQARAVKPAMIICGASAYSRDWDYERLRAIADEVGAILLADISHPSGLIARGILNDPVHHCHIVTTTTHKTLRGPRGGMIMVGTDFENPMGLKSPKGEVRMMSQVLDSAVFPGTQGGPLEHVIGAKAVAYGEALTDSFFDYILRVVQNAQSMGEAFMNRGYQVISGGTDNHLLLIDLRSKGVTGRDAERALGRAHITVNKNMVPFDDQSPFVTSGIRVGTPAITTRGVQPEHIDTIVSWIDGVIQNVGNDAKIDQIGAQVSEMMSSFPLFSMD